MNKATEAKAAKAAKVVALKAAEAEAKDEVGNTEQEAPKQATHVLYPMNLVQALLSHFTQTPHNMADVEGIVNGLRQGEQIAR
jgi:hypothetical protein